MLSVLPRLDYGGFSLIEYLLSNENFKKGFKVLDIGGALGKHCQIMREFGLSVDTIDKYEKKAEFVGDFNKYDFTTKYDMIYCSHVIEHQRNQGFFLDKIFDLLNKNGDLVISGPKHPAERFVEGHISTTILPVFLQLLIYAGFDCKNGKMMSLGGIENSFIVKKSKNFKKNERDETGYKWTQKHRDRSPIELIAGFEVRPNGLYLNNCDIFKVHMIESPSTANGVAVDQYGNEKVGLMFSPPKNYKKKGIGFYINIHENFFIFDNEQNELANRKSDYIFFEI
tara:strand:- start:171 stop:1019 length:849 start_codon:yes stop_codon:yes gene_type:complete